MIKIEMTINLKENKLDLDILSREDVTKDELIIAGHMEKLFLKIFEESSDIIKDIKIITKNYYKAPITGLFFYP